MKNSILFFTILSLAISVFSQENNYFDKKRDYIYNTIYIDSLGDTIITEKLILRVLGRRWIAQPGLQKSIRYIYDTDTSEYKNFINPDAYQHERNQRRYKNRGKSLCPKNQQLEVIKTNTIFTCILLERINITCYFMQHTQGFILVYWKKV